MDTAGHAFGIDDKDHRRLQDSCHMSGGCKVRPINAVVHSHHAFNNGDICSFCCPQECFNAPPFAHHERVQVPGRPPADPGMMRWIDEVRSCLKWLDFHTPCGKRSHNATGDGCFTTPAVRAGDDNTGNGAHCSPPPSALAGSGMVTKWFT